jgi:hypothetical protein
MKRVYLAVRLMSSLLLGASTAQAMEVGVAWGVPVRAPYYYYGHRYRRWVRPYPYRVGWVAPVRVRAYYANPYPYYYAPGFGVRLR